MIVPTDPAATNPTAIALPHDVIILAGGGGTRLGGVDKAALEVAGRSLLSRVLDGVDHARRVVVVGNVEVPDGVLQTVEKPAGGGPVAGIVAGRSVLDGGSEWTLVVAVDQPSAARAMPTLLHAAAHVPAEIDMVCPHDETGHPQWLLAAYRTTALTRALAPLGTGHDTSVRRLVQGLRIADAPSPHTGDIDTWADHAAWQEHLSE